MNYIDYIDVDYYLEKINTLSELDFLECKNIVSKKLEHKGKVFLIKYLRDNLPYIGLLELKNFVDLLDVVGIIDKSKYDTSIIVNKNIYDQFNLKDMKYMIINKIIYLQYSRKNKLIKLSNNINKHE